LDNGVRQKAAGDRANEKIDPDRSPPGRGQGWVYPIKEIKKI
jgi:hypothetical protein